MLHFSTDVVYKGVKMVELQTVWMASPIASGSAPLLAYVGPGVGLTLLAALWAVILAILSAIGAILYWPIRSFLRKRRQQQVTPETGEQAEQKLLAQSSKRD